MSLYYPLSPVEMLCPDCAGHGRLQPESICCTRCDSIGRVFIQGGPSFGCKIILGTRNIGEVVTLGNGDRGRVVLHSRRGTHTTMVALIDEMFDAEERTPTSYPSSTGVKSTMPSLSRPEDQSGRKQSRVDHSDPLQKEMKAL